MINTFEFLINTAVESLEMVGEADKKATICAQLAQAIALSGVLKKGIETEEVATTEEIKTEVKAKDEPKKNTKKKTSKKDSLKTENTKASVTEEPIIEVPVEEPVAEIPTEEPAAPVAEEPVVEIPAEEPAAPVATEPEMTDEWTDEMQTLKEEQLALLQAYVEAWGEDFVYNDCLGAFSEGAFVGGENVRPSNIDGFVMYLNELAQQNAQ